MRLASTLFLIAPVIALSGCASQQTLESQAESVSRQLAAMKQSQTSMADSQKTLEARLARLESEQALIAPRLNQSDSTHKRDLDTLRGHIAATQQELATLGSKIDTQSSGIAQAQSTAEDAIKIARDSRLVSGKVIDKLVLTEEMVLFSYEAPELTPAGRAALDKLIASARPQLPHVFIEIIGFSDNTGLGSQNSRIALERAESVRRYLHEVGTIPLHRMSSISYGDLKPISTDPTFESRRQNRRVIVQVLK